VTDLASDLATLRIERKQRAARPWRWSVPLIASALLFAAVVYGLRARRVLAGVEVETTSAVGGPAGAPILTASGYLVARRKAVVSAKIQGRLSELRVEEASQVRQGEVIARLESEEYEAQVERAHAAVQRAEADLAEYRRQLRLAEDLAEAGVLAVDQREAAASRVKIAEAALRQAQAELRFSRASLENTRIRAPFTGTVVKKMAEVGESVAPIPPGVNISISSGAIVAVADLDTLEVEADVSETSVSKLRRDQPAEVTVEAFPDRKCRAVLRQIIPTADRTKATVQVKVTILDKYSDFKPEMSAKVTFMEREDQQAGSTPGAPVVMVPRDAVAMREGRAVIFEVRNGRARKCEVALGADREGRVVVKSGLSGGEILVAHPPETLRDGNVVRVKT
jgi:HlyD family secretion protein